ncbi:iron-sulfur cluster assembly accessory protein [Candidatus Poribacteria bacterium]|nr:iron-sulfur cluster assembly accessory protein [Candidatus Poribacteria bacterium]
MINVTEAAAQKAITLISSGESDSETDLGLRMKVIGGGCSGFQYDLEFGEAKGTDRVFEFHGLKVFIDPRSSLYLAGSVLDYNDGLMESGFKITNPNAKNTCGCGESFSV